jgi:hypothetical protein
LQRQWNRLKPFLPAVREVDGVPQVP